MARFDLQKLYIDEGEILIVVALEERSDATFETGHKVLASA